MHPILGLFYLKPLNGVVLKKNFEQVELDLRVGCFAAFFAGHTKKIKTKKIAYKIKNETIPS
jgi:hypothetical protein